MLCVMVAAGVCPVAAAPLKKLDKPSISEHWFGIYVDNERVGFYRQKIAETADGYRFAGSFSRHFNAITDRSRSAFGFTVRGSTGFLSNT